MRPLAVLIFVVGAVAALVYALSSITSSTRGAPQPAHVVEPAHKPTARPQGELTEALTPAPIEAERTVVEASDPVAAPPRGAFGGGIEGIVVDEEGLPVEKATVSLVNKRPGAFADTLRVVNNAPPPRPVRQVVTKADGTFSFANLDPDKPWTLVVTHPDFSRAEEGPIPVPENDVRRETIRMRRGLVCEGFVYDADTGRPIEGATLVVDNPLAAFMATAWRKSPTRVEVRTDATGRYAFKNVSQGQKTLIISAPGYATQVHNNFQMLVLKDPDRPVINNQVQTKKLVPQSRDFRLARGYSIGGRVVAPDRSGVEGVEVEAISQTGAIGSRGKATTLANGEFLIEDLAEGLYTLQVTAPGYQASPVQRVETGSTDVLIELAEQGSVAGRVLGPDGRPLTKAFSVRVRAIHPGSDIPGAPVSEAQFRSPKGGAFQVSNIPEGHYVVEALASGFASSFSDPFDVAQGITTDQIEVRMSQGGRLTGRVLDSYTGEPIAGAEVSTNDNNWVDNEFFQLFSGLSTSPLTKGKATTDKNGVFRLKLLTPGRYQVQIKSRDFTTLVLNDVDVRPDEETDLGDQMLVRGATIRGVVYSNGEPEPGATVQLTPMDHTLMWAGQRTRTDAEGRFVLRNVQAGSYKLYGQRTARPGSNPWEGVADMRDSEIQITIADGGDYTYDLHFGRRP